jgi:tetratricopeptide (TPR) repeat protein
MTGAAAWLLILVSLLFAYRQFWSDIYVNQAIMASVNLDSERSYAWIKRAQAYTPWKEQIGGTKARLELYLNNPEGALESARKSLLSSPYSLPGLWAYGLAAGELGHERESRAAFQKIVTLYPFLPDIETYRQFAENESFY